MLVLLTMIGPVPVTIRPYIKLDLALQTMPLEVSSGVTCKYTEEVSIGYVYDRAAGQSEPVRERKVTSKGCTRKAFKINIGPQNDEKCPTSELGMFYYFVVFSVLLSVLLMNRNN